MPPIFKIVDVEADARESTEHIVTGFIKVRINNSEFWAFVPNWSAYFPHHTKISVWGGGNRLLTNLVGRKVELKFKFICLSSWQKFEARKKAEEIRQPPNARSSNETVLTARVKKVRIIEQAIEYTLDCGFPILTKSMPGALSIGEWVRGHGILQADILSIDGEKIEQPSFLQ